MAGCLGSVTTLISYARVLQLVSQMNGRFFLCLRNGFAGRIELVVIYREIHLLRLLQQTLPPIKAEQRWVDKYTERQNLMSARMRILRTEYMREPGERSWRKITLRRRVCTSGEMVGSWFRNNYQTWFDLVDCKKINGPSLILRGRRIKRHNIRNFIWLRLPGYTAEKRMLAMTRWNVLSIVRSNLVIDVSVVAQLRTLTGTLLTERHRYWISCIRYFRQLLFCCNKIVLPKINRFQR